MRVIAAALSTLSMLIIKVLFALTVSGAIWGRRSSLVLEVSNFAMVGVVLYNALIITYALKITH